MLAADGPAPTPRAARTDSERAAAKEGSAAPPALRLRCQNREQPPPLPTLFEGKVLTRLSEGFDKRAGEMWRQLRDDAAVLCAA